MPYLKTITKPYSVRGIAWTGSVAEYEGIFPEQTDKSHYLVLCLRTDSAVISFTITAPIEVFAANVQLYRWLMQNQLDIYVVRKGQLAGAT